MDIVRPKSVARKKKIKNIVLLILVLIVASAMSLGLSRMKPAAPTVERGTVWIDTVKRGEMRRQVHGAGTLAPEEVRWIPAASDGIIEEVKARPGDKVGAASVVLIMSNPDVRQRATDAELQLKGAEADLTNLRATLQNEILIQQAVQAGVESEYNKAKLDYEADQELSKDGLIANLTLKKAEFTAEELASKNEMEKKKVESNSKSAEARIAAQQARIDQLRAAYQLRLKQLDDLSVRAGAEGIVQQVPVEAGQHVGPGTILAKVAEPGRLKAELQIPETQVKDVATGQIAAIDTRNGIIPGRVIRIDPAAANGTVKVDVQLEGKYPKGVRPDLSIDGTIDIDRLANVLYIGRPAYGLPESTAGIFRLNPSGELDRIQVQFGRSSVNQMEIVRGLREGDQVILSDMSAWDAYDRVRLN
jgi:HlyD family secretion protein